VTTAIRLPELGENVDSGELTKILVSAGDTISKDQALVELETDKATIEVPSPVSGTIKELHVQEGRKVKVGDLLLTVEEDAAAATQKEKPREQPELQDQSGVHGEAREERQASPAAIKKTGSPTAEATVPTPARAETAEPQSKQEARPAAKPERVPPPQKGEAKPATRAETPAEVEADTSTDIEGVRPADSEREQTVIPFRAEASEQAPRPARLAPASPSIRRLARELGVDINKVNGTGPEGRIDEADVKNYARQIISGVVSARLPGEAFGAMPDFAKWGQIERKPVSSVRRATAEHLTQAWHNVPQVTQFDSADVTDLESLRSCFSQRQDAGAAKITVTAVALKVIAAALGKFPQFAASMDIARREVIYKHYCNIGIAVDTSYGLVVPVVRDADQKSFAQLARELTELSAKAREKRLSLEEMAGGVFTITNLGGIGGTGFSPIVNYPEVAILGISRLRVEPKLIDGSFQPRKILPLSLSYDHRLIDGADAARFLRWVAEAMEQPALLLFRS
jgi:pyruvate dehydrogenase E2 component (dihydrolipoamide acetyltransferase)